MSCPAPRPGLPPLRRALCALGAWFCLGPGAALAGPLGMGDFVSPGPLAAPHAHLSGITQCTQCHAMAKGVTADKCLACHDSVVEQIETNSGFHRNRGDECAGCHPDHLGADFSLIILDEEHFAHGQETGFFLEGAHHWLACDDCHPRGNWGNVEPVCETCHEDPHRRVSRARPLPECDACHGAEDWEVTSVDRAVHDHTDPDQADYLLEGAHLEVECVDCHVGAVFAPTQHDTCTECHADLHRADFASDCTECHDVGGWGVDPFEHELTGYVLEGVHARVECDDCHGSKVWDPFPHATCDECHRDPHERQFRPDPCDSCHSVQLADFALDAFDHDLTDFPLYGNHIEVECAECHGEGPTGTYRDRAHEDCDECHTDIHEGQFEPTDCKVCHVEEGWHVEDFDHDRTDFPLEGSHAEVECAECHPDEQWSGIHHDFCEDCHDDHLHGTAFEPQSCDGCHTPVAFDQVRFAHAEETEFDLAPQHTEADCMSCHEALDRFEGLRTSCSGCHGDDQPLGHYEGACEDCHDTAWVPASLGDHDHDITGFSLNGAHTLVPCDGCHGAEGRPFGSQDHSCISCHASDDIHRNLLGPMCDDCHTEIGWFRTRFRHQRTGWPLRGAHRLAACVDCHAVSYTGTPQDCRACHEASTPLDIPAHQGADFPLCERCHRPYTWAVLRPGTTP